MTRAHVRVRPATLDDVPGLVELEQSMGGVLGMPKTSGERLEQRFAEIISEDNRILLVAVDESAAIAGLLCARNDDVGVVDVTPVLHVTQLIVTPCSRRRGVGRALLAAAVQAADDSGADHMVVTATAASREGNRYFARIGFAPLVVQRIAPTSVLRRSLGMTEAPGRVAVLRRARVIRAQRAGFAATRSL